MQKILEKIYEDFILECESDRKTEKTENFEKSQEIEQEIQLLIDEINSIKQANSSNIDISIFRRILKNIEMFLNLDDLKEKSKNVKNLSLLIKEASELEKQAFAFQLSEIGILRNNINDFESKLEQKNQKIADCERIIMDKNEDFKKIESEKEDYKIKLTENMRKFERILRENEKLLKEIEGLREEIYENKENLDKKQEILKENYDKKQKILKKKEKHKERKEKLRSAEEDLKVKSEENKKMFKEISILKEFKINNENEVKLLRAEINLCQEEK